MIRSHAVSEQLAIDGGTPVCSEPCPVRNLIDATDKEAVAAYFDDVIAGTGMIGYGGEKEKAYEQAFADFLGGGFAHAVCSGTNAVFCALGGLQLPRGSEVIVPAITDPGGVMPVAILGMVPVAADTRPDSYNVSAQTIAAKITDKTRAIIVAHIAGEPVDMEPVMALAKKHDLKVIEDCAQAPGATYKGKAVGNFGHVAAFSTMFGKHFCTGGSGGMVFSTDEATYWNCRRFADRGKPINMDKPAGNIMAGLNCNSDELAAVIGLNQLGKLPGIIERRRAVAAQLRQRLADETKTVIPGAIVPDTEPAYWFLRVKYVDGVVDMDKTTFCAALTAEGIPVAASYRHIPVNMPWSDWQTDLPQAMAVTDAQFNISIHERWGQSQMDDVIAAIKKIELCRALS